MGFHTTAITVDLVITIELKLGSFHIYIFSIEPETQEFLRRFSNTVESLNTNKRRSIASDLLIVY